MTLLRLVAATSIGPGSKPVPVGSGAHPGRGGHHRVGGARVPRDRDQGYRLVILRLG